MMMQDKSKICGYVIYQNCVKCFGCMKVGIFCRGVQQLICSCAGYVYN
jgi:hypothetical protein